MRGRFKVLSKACKPSKGFCYFCVYCISRHIYNRFRSSKIIALGIQKKWTILVLKFEVILADTVPPERENVRTCSGISMRNNGFLQ